MNEACLESTAPNGAGRAPQRRSDVRRPIKLQGLLQKLDVDVNFGSAATASRGASASNGEMLLIGVVEMFDDGGDAALQSGIFLGGKCGLIL